MIDPLPEQGEWLPTYNNCLFKHGGWPAGLGRPPLSLT